MTPSSRRGGGARRFARATLQDIVDGSGPEKPSVTLAVATFLAISLAALAGVVVAVLAVTGQLGRIRSAIGPGALWLAFAVALTATLGSLYFSEVADSSRARCAGISGLPCTRWR